MSARSTSQTDPDHQHVVARRLEPSDTPDPVTPDDAVPRLVGVGADARAAQELVEQYGRTRVIDALDALDELDADRRILDPVGWVEAAVEHGWNLTGVLAARRERDQRLGRVEADQQRRRAADDALPSWRAVADGWAAAVSGALDDDQLRLAIEQLTDEVPGLGRRSTPVARAQLVAWAVDVHERADGRQFADALREDLDRDGSPRVIRDWPLPEPPETATSAEVEPLADRIAAAIDPCPELDVPQPRAGLEPPHRTVRVAGELW